VEPAEAIGAIVVERCHKIAAEAAEIGFDINKSKELRTLLEERPA
jgi:hypothetical protein